MSAGTTPVMCTCGKRMPRIGKDRYACRACGQRWKDAGMAAGFLTMCNSSWLTDEEVQSMLTLDALSAGAR